MKSFKRAMNWATGKLPVVTGSNGSSAVVAHFRLPITCLSVLLPLATDSIAAHSYLTAGTLESNARQHQRELCPALRQIFGTELAGVLLDDAVADRQAQAGTFADALGGKEGVEDA